MQPATTVIPGVLLLDPVVYEDQRGWFAEVWNRAEFDALGIDADFVQDNHSHSRQNVLRGLHYQVRHPQGKLIRVVRGAAWAVAVDLRPESPQFGRWAGFELTADNRRLAWLPPRLAFGFYVTGDEADLAYKVTNHRFGDHERSIRWDDPDLAIEWPLAGATPVLSKRDREATPFADADLPEPSPHEGELR